MVKAPFQESLLPFFFFLKGKLLLAQCSVLKVNMVLSTFKIVVHRFGKNKIFLLVGSFILLLKDKYFFPFYVALESLMGRVLITFKMWWSYNRQLSSWRFWVCLCSNVIWALAFRVMPVIVMLLLFLIWRELS